MRIYEARRLLDQVRKEHRKEIRQIELERVKSSFDEYVRQYARPSEVAAFDNLVKTAQRSIDNPGQDFEIYLKELKNNNFGILWRQDWFVIGQFKYMASSPHRFIDKHRFEELTKSGMQFMRSDDIGKLRTVVAQLSEIAIGGASDYEMSDIANIIRG